MPRRRKNSAPEGSSQIGAAPLLCPSPNLPNNEYSFLQTELFHFFLSSAQPWRLTGEVSLSILVNFFKIVIVTSQLILFGSLSSTRVSYRERAQLAFNHLYLHDWDPQYETLPYPPSTGVYGFYTRARFYEAVGFTLHQYNKTEDISLGGYTFTDTNRSLTVCIKQVDSASQTSAKHTIGDSSVVCQIFSIVYISPERISSWEHTKAFLDAHGLDIDFSRFLQLTLNFSLISPPINHIDWDSSIECFHFDVNICFENSGQSGQVVGNLNSALTEIECNSSTRTQKEDEGGRARKLHRVVHLVVDLLAFNICLVSLALCSLSGCRGLRLWKRTQQFFTEYYGIRLRGVFFDFVNRWNFVVIVGDFLILAGSISKLIHNNDILEAYFVLSYLLGLGTFFVWISVLRYVELSSRSHLLLRTINRSVPGLLRFCACGLVLYFAFVFPAWVILGPFHMKFRSFTSTLECLFSLINGDDMYVTFSIIDATKGSNIYLFSRIFLYIFITLFIYAVLNIFVTIIFEAYEEVKEGKEPESDGMAILKRFIAQRSQTNLDSLDPDNEFRPSVNATARTLPVNRMSSSSVTTVTSAGTVEGISMGRPGNNEDWDVGPRGESSGTGNDNVVNLEARAGEEETYFNESFESEPSPFSTNKDSNAHTRTPHEVPSLPVNSEHLRRQPQSRRRRNVMRGPKICRPQQNYHRYRPTLSTGAIVSLETELSLEAWQASQNLIASLRSENHLLQSQLKECRVELRTVQRQCKVQNARLTKAVGREAEMPAVIERLNAEVRAMQVRLQRKKEAAEAAERRALDAEARLLPLLEKRDRRSVTVSSAASVSAPVSGHGETKNHTKATEALQSALDEERRRHGELQKKLEMMERNHRAEQGVANEQIRKLRKFANELQGQLSAVTRNLQEKTKLLELQNIYSQRFPKSVVTQTTGMEHQRERGRASGDRSLEGDVPGETLHRYSSHRLANSRLPSNDSNGDGEKRRRSRHNVCPISSMVAKMKNGLFTRSYTTISNTRGGDDTVEGKEPSTTAGGILSRSLKVTTNNFPVPAARGRRKNEHRKGDDTVQAATTAGAEMTINPAIANSGSSTCSDDETMSDLRDNFHKVGGKRDVTGKRNAPQPKEGPLGEAKLSSIEKKMQEENGQSVTCQETPESKEEEALTKLPHSTKSDLPTPPGGRSEQNSEEFLWRSIFGKESSDLLSFITSHPVSSLASAENETSKMGTVETKTVREAIEPTGSRSLRRQNSVRNPLDDLDLDKIKL